VWLLAARFHRSGKKDDAYPYFRALDHDRRLLPKHEDYVAALKSLDRDVAERLVAEVPPVREAAKRSPGTIQEAVLAGRTRVRVVFEDGDPPMLTVAISQNLLPGESKMPAEWQLMVAAAFLPFTTPPEDLSLTGNLAGNPLADDEIAYCDFADEW
jgi:hypothetical protein